MEDFQFHLPTLPEQRAIARILGALDDKIEANRRVNTILMSIIRAIFKSWFIDFDPIHAKANGHTLKEIEADTAKLFPSAFNGGIPAEWKIAKFNDILTPMSDRIGN